MLKGYMDHEDFTGSAGTLGPGDLQFMTAGRGIVHAEMPRVAPEDSSTSVAEGLQLWVDLPENLKIQNRGIAICEKRRFQPSHQTQRSKSR